MRYWARQAYDYEMQMGIYNRTHMNTAVHVFMSLLAPCKIKGDPAKVANEKNPVSHHVPGPV